MSKHRKGRRSEAHRNPVPVQHEPSESLDTSRSRSLFHYTTAEGLIGIIENQSLYATHAEFLNDSTECRSILNVLMPRLEAELRHVIPKLIERKLIDGAILTKIGDTIYRKQAQKMLDAMSLATNKVAPYFITSFCVHKPNTEAYEHGLLSQWRGYGRGGFAIELDELQIDELNKSEAAKFRYQGIMTESVIYRNHGEKVSDELFGGFASAFLKNLFPGIGDLLHDILGSKETEDFARPFLSITPFLKDAHFEEENEYRIAALCNRPSVCEDGDEREAKPLNFKTRANGRVMPFISLYEGLEIKLPIKAVVVGPHQSQPSHRAAVELLLEKHGMANIPVRLSAIPFRE